MDDAHGEEALDIEIRSTSEIVRRAAVLAAIAERGVLEVDADRNAYERDTDRFELLSWVRGVLADTVTDDEVRLLATPVGELGDDVATCEAALVEASTLAWTLTVEPAVQLPIPQDGDAEERLMAWAPAPWTDLDRLASQVEARSEEAIATERERWELWYWRAVDADVMTETVADVIADIDASGLIPIAGDDLATDAAEPFAELSPDQQEDIAWLAERRLKALNWVCGFGVDWGSVPLYPD